MRRDDVDLLIEHAEQLLAAFDVLAKLKKLAGDAAASEIAGGVGELFAKIGLAGFEIADLFVAAIALLAEGGAPLGQEGDFLFGLPLVGEERLHFVDKRHE